jgi:hypothetical protein
VWGWIPISVLGLLTAGAVVLGISMQGTAPATQLDAVLSATYTAGSYVSTTTYVPESARFRDSTERTVINAPNLYETINNGVAREIVVGNTTYSAVPRSCSTRVRFVAYPKRPLGVSVMLKMRNRITAGGIFAADAVSRFGDTYTVSRNGQEIESFLVQNGYVIRSTTYLSALVGNRRLPSEVVSFTDIGHGPKIVVPPPTEVVAAPHVFIHGSTICQYS